MTNNLLPFDPKKVKNGMTVIDENGKEMTFVTMDGPLVAVCKSNLMSGDYYGYPAHLLRLRPRMVKRKIDIFTENVWTDSGKNVAIPLGCIYITTIEIEVPEE